VKAWLAALLLCALALGGCETTAEKSAQLEHAAKHVSLGSEQELTITKPSAYVKVVATQVLHSGEQTAAVVTLRNRSTHTVRDAPIAITVRGANGSVLFKNNAPGLEAALSKVALLPAGAQTTWIDDQVQTTKAPASATAVVGEGARASASIPQLRVGGIHTIEDPASGPGAAGTVTNRSAVTQDNLVLYALARRDGRIVAAGRAVLPEVPAHGSSPFEVFFVGDAKGAQLQVSAPPSTF
jgi:hypothetical protein